MTTPHRNSLTPQHLLPSSEVSELSAALHEPAPSLPLTTKSENSRLPSNTEDDHSSHNSSEAAEDKNLPPFTIFTGIRRTFLIVLLSVVGMWSAISNSIYFPALPTLTEYFNVSSELMNVSVVAYLLSQGLMPTITSNLSDSLGRRPVILASFAVYIGANIGLSQTNVYWLLAVLRCVQAAGIAPVIAVSSGLSGDVCTRANRGAFVGIVSGMLLVGQAFGSLIGSGLISTWDWRAVFVFLAIGAGVTLVFLIVFLTETSRSIVGNGSVRPKNLLYAAPALGMPMYRKHLTNDTSTLAPRVEIDFLSPFKILIQPKVICVLLPGGLQFASWTMCLTSLSTNLEKSPYNYSVSHVGLLYLPQGICCLVGALIAGKVLNMYYKWQRDKYDRKYADADESCVPRFNNLRVRLDVSIIPIVCTLFGLLLFGWMLDRNASVAGVVIGLCFVSFGCACFVAIMTTMLVDLYPTRGSASTSCVNLARCFLAAAGVAALDKMCSTMGIGWCYTLLTGLCFATSVLLVLVVVHHLKGLKVQSSPSK